MTLTFVFYLSRNSWLQHEAVLHLWAGQNTSYCQSRYYATPVWPFTQVCVRFQTVWAFSTDKLKDCNNKSLLRQGHSIWGGQSHDGAERGNRLRTDSAPAWDGVGQHHHAHGLPEPDRGVHPERIRAHLLLKLKQSQASSSDLGQKSHVMWSARFTFACT